jgi:hypothetical protein
MRISRESRDLDTSYQIHDIFPIINLFKIEEQKFVSAMEASHRRNNLRERGFCRGEEAGRGRNGGGVLKRAVELR